MIKAIIFDFDGVIGDSEALANTVLAQMVTELGHPTTLEQSYRTYMGKRLEDVLTTIQDVTGRPLPGDFATQFQARTLAALAADLQPVAGIFDYLAAFVDIEVAIASSSAPERLAVCLRKLELEARFGPRVFSAAMVARGKPYPDIFLYAAMRLGVAPPECLVIEDSVSGTLSAKAAGMHVIGLLAATHIQPAGAVEHAENLRRVGADAIAHTYVEAAEYTRSLLASVPVVFSARGSMQP